MSRRWDKLDTSLGWLLVLAALAVRVPFRSALAWHWDSAQFVLALDRFNPALSVPHAPGYLLYIWLGRGVRSVAGDGHASLVWISVVAGSALVGVIYLLASRWFGRSAGLAAGLFALTSPQLWFHSEVALTYVVDGLLVCLLVGRCVRVAARGDGRWTDAIGLGLVLAVIGGVRQQSVPALAPVLLYTCWRFPRRRRLSALVMMAVVAAAGAMVWFLPLVRASGGWAAYRELVQRHVLNNTPVTWIGGGWPSLLDNIDAVTVHCWNGLLLATGLLIGALAYRAWVMDPAARTHWNRMHRQELAILALWVVPMVLFGTAIGFTSQPGYVIGYLPALVVLGGAAVGALRRRWLAVALTALVTMVNVGVFTGWPLPGDGVLVGAKPTARAIREHDRQLAQAVTAIRRHCAPDRVVILHPIAAHYRFGLRLFQLYLPEFEQVQLPPDPTVLCPPDAPLLGVRGGRTVCVLPDGWRAARDLVLIVPPPLTVSVFDHWLDPALAQPLPGTDGLVWVVSEAAGNDHRDQEDALVP